MIITTPRHSSLTSWTRLPLFSHRKPQRKWNVLGGTPTLLSSPLPCAEACPLTSFPWYPQNPCLGDHDHPPSPTSLPLETPGQSLKTWFPQTPSLTCSLTFSHSLQGQGWEMEQVIFLICQYSFQIIPPPIFWENPLLFNSHLYLPYFPITPLLTEHLSTQLIVFPPTFIFPHTVGDSEIHLSFQFLDLPAPRGFRGKERRH